MIVWALLSDEDARFVDLGPDYYDSAPTHSAGSGTMLATAGAGLHGDLQSLSLRFRPSSHRFPDSARDCRPLGHLRFWD